MSKILHILIIIGLLNAIIYILGNYLLNYLNFIFYHLSLGVHIILSKFLTEQTVSIVMSGLMGTLIFSLILFIINLIKD